MKLISTAFLYAAWGGAVVALALYSGCAQPTTGAGNQQEEKSEHSHGEGGEGRGEHAADHEEGQVGRKCFDRPVFFYALGEACFPISIAKFHFTLLMYYDLV